MERMRNADAGRRSMKREGERKKVAMVVVVMMILVRSKSGCS
jgi:hypothetical protein